MATNRWLSFVHDITWEALPVEVQCKKVKMCLLDALEAALSGTLTRISRLIAEYTAEAWKGDEPPSSCMAGGPRLACGLRQRVRQGLRSE